MSEQKSIFDVLSPQQTFVAGIVGGFLVLCTIGFFILASLLWKGTLSFDRSGSGTPVAAAPSVNAGTNTAPTPTPSADVPAVDLKTDHIRGNKNAKITIIEYSDFQCPYCQQFHETVKQIVAKYDVRWVFRHFPLTSIHPYALPGALASECVSEQAPAKFWDFADGAFAAQAAGFSATTYETIAKGLGINMKTYASCVSSNKYGALITKQSNDAQASGGRGTPHSILIGPNGEKELISGAQPYAAVEQLIQKYVK